jgi:hypothetical protein
MSVSSVLEFLEKFQTEKVLRFLENMRVGELIHNPIFLGATGLLAVVALIMRWRLLLAVIVSLAGFAGLASYTMQRGTELDGLASETLLIFAGGGVVIIFIFIYLLFIRND